MPRRLARAAQLAGILCVGLLGPCTLHAAEPDVETQLRTFGDALQAARQIAWRTYAGSAALGRDARGRTIGQDVNESLMSPATLRQLQTLRSAADQAHQAADDAKARVALASATALLDEQGQTLALISYYWAEKLVIDRQRELWQRWLAQVPENVATASRARLAPLEAGMVQALSPTATREGLVAQVRSLLDTLNAERNHLAGLISEQRVAAGSAGPAQERTLPCPEPQAPAPRAAAAAPGGLPAPDRPVKILTSPDVARFYPDEARRAFISGRVLVRLSIDGEGCMQRAEVVHSSGVPELDDAALDLPQFMSFLPRIQNGQAIPVQTTLPVNFALFDDARSAAASPPPGGASATALAQRGSDLLDHGQYAAAIEQFDQAIAQDPSFAMAYAGRGMAHLWARNGELATRDFDQAVALDARNAVAFHGRGVMAFQDGRYAEAIALFSRALQFWTDDSLALAWRAQAHLLTGDLPAVLSDAERMTRLTPVDYRGYPLKALVLRLQDKPEEALAIAEELIRANGGQADPLAAAAEIYAAAGKPAEAMQALDQALAIVPSARLYLIHLSYRDKTDFAGRRADIDAALKQDPHAIAPTIALARLQADMGAFQEAQATLDAALASNSGQLDLTLARGIVHARSGELQRAEQDFAPVRAAAYNGTAHNNLCWNLATAGVALSEALNECDAAVADSPHEGSFLDSRGFVLLRLGRYRDAIEAYDAALERRPMLAVSLYGRGLAKRGAGETAAAETDLQQAMTLDASVRRRFADYGL
jgi:TonB family protein